MEELRREQEAHDRRTAEFEKRRNEVSSQVTGIALVPFSLVHL
jgi:hypothetical protein